MFSYQDAALVSLPGAVMALGLRFPADTKDSNGFIETLHRGWAVVVDISGNTVWETDGASDYKTFFRSAAKPFQAYSWLSQLPEIVLEPQEIAIACASHSATEEQLAWVQRLLSRLDVNTGAENLLRCGPQMPLDAQVKKKLRASGSKETPLHNNCSGKHAGILWGCHCLHLDQGSYLSTGHELQQKTLEILATLGGIEQAEIGVSTDGCGLPTFYMPLRTMARLFAQLATNPDFEPIVRAMTGFPELVAAEGRIDTEVMRASRGRLLSKVGADGLICITNLERRQGLALKIADGSHYVRDVVVCNLLGSLGWLTPEEQDDGRLEPWRKPWRKNTLDQVVGITQVLDL